MQISLKNFPIHLLPEGGVFLSETRTLVVADVHLGKSATFRTRGIPIPEGDTDHDLDRLTQLIKTHKPCELVIAGDLVHAADGLTSHTLEKLAVWLDLQKIPVILTEGNHDKKSRLPTFSLKIVSFYLAGEIHITHDPADLPNDHAGLAGHLHPSYRLRLSPRESHRFKGFHLRHPHHLVLPAFSKFTGTHPIIPFPHDRFFALTAKRCQEIPLAKN